MPPNPKNPPQGSLQIICKQSNRSNIFLHRPARFDILLLPSLPACRPFFRGPIHPPTHPPISASICIFIFICLGWMQCSAGRVASATARNAKCTGGGGRYGVLLSWALLYVYASPPLVQDDPWRTAWTAAVAVHTLQQASRCVPRLSPQIVLYCTRRTHVRT